MKLDTKKLADTLLVPLVYVTGIWLLCVGLLLASRILLGGFEHNLERFGMIHILALLITFAVAFITNRGISGNA